MYVMHVLALNLMTIFLCDILSLSFVMNIRIQNNFKGNQWNAVVSTLFANGLAWLGTRAYKVFVVTNFLSCIYHDDVIKWKHFPRYWPFVWGIQRPLVNSPHKGQWRGALMFSLICVWINGWINNHEAGNLRRNCTHYDIIVMCRTNKCLLGIFEHNIDDLKLWGSLQWQIHVWICVIHSPEATTHNSFISNWLLRGNIM